MITKLRTIVIVCISLTLIAAQAQDNVGQSVIALLNSARNEADIPSLLVSPELNVAAQRHSDDMARNRVLDHTGSDGTAFWQRMVASGYNLTTGAENILLRNDTNSQSVYSQWKNSPPHRANMMSAEYVEVGIGYAQATDGTYYFTMVLGTRDGITAPSLPTATTAPPTRVLPSSTPTSSPTHTSLPPIATTLPPPTATLNAPVRTIIPATPLPTLTASITPIPPTSTPVLPPDLLLKYDDSVFSLINVSGGVLDLREVSFLGDDRDMNITVWDTPFLSQPLSGFTNGDCLQVWSLSDVIVYDKPADCETRHAWVGVFDRQLFWKDTDTFFVRNNGKIVGQCFAVDGECEVNLSREISQLATPIATQIFSTERDIRLIFNSDSLTVLNISGQTLNLHGLEFRSTSGRLPIEAWETEFLTRALSSIPAGDCIMAYLNDVQAQTQSASCGVRHGWIVVGDDADFWRNTNRFEVVKENIVLAGCVVANGTCDVSLEGNLGANSPTVAPQNPVQATPVVENSGGSQPVTTSSSSADLTMIYSNDSFTLVNTSGHTLDISRLIFESDNGVFSADRWNTDFLTRALSDFPSGDCLQVWGVNEELQSKPASCSTRHGWIAVTVGQQFWREALQMRVRNGVEQIGTCDLRAGQCVVNFP